MGDDYTILQVEHKKEWPSRYGQMKDYAIHIQKAGSPDPEPGWIQLSQKLETPPPRQGGRLHGYIETKDFNGNSYKKFKKVNPDGQAHRSGSFGDSGGGQAPSATIGDSSQVAYIVQMLEELTGRREVVDDQKKEPEKGEDFPTDEQLEDPFKDLV